ncbi:MAG TPA: YerC/YecD family TrpR-related protein [Candidatus Woesebacteria bacterium]|nr:YerC/YecD family TrpR-related protein [Candidatus Woesebacteria bacterium]HNS65687.1 YerC/YecD family TrpR-related protein [Candidatus Woesebacteria bacterium]
MTDTSSTNQKTIIELAKVLTRLENPSKMLNFLYDVATPKELEELAQRFQIAKLLWTTNLSYVEIAGQTNASTTTVTRVARFLNQEPFGGYRQVLNTFYPRAETKNPRRRKT